jgi:hypothetical protein
MFSHSLLCLSGRYEIGPAAVERIRRPKNYPHEQHFYTIVATGSLIANVHNCRKALSWNSARNGFS